jgi:hypothetical protein
MKNSNKIMACLLLIAMAMSGCTIVGGQLQVIPACSGTSLNGGFTSFWANWQSLALLAASTVFVVAILIYTIGYAIDHKKAISWAKNEMAEAIISILLVIFMIMLVSAFCGFDMNSLGITPSCGIVGEPPCCGVNGEPNCPASCNAATVVSTCGGAGQPSCSISDVAFGYLTTMYTTIMQGYLLVIGINSALAAAASLTVGFSPGGVGVVFAPLAGLAQVADSLLLASIALLTGAILTLTQMILLKMAESLFVILFPIGVVLRCFGATRGFGGGLMAIGIGFFIMYPLLTLLFYGALLDPDVTVSYSLQTSYSNFCQSFQTAGTSPANTSWLNTNMLSFITGFLGNVIMGAIIIPLVMFMILVAFVKGLSMALGEEVDVSNLTRLI